MKKNALYFSVNVLSTKVLIGDTIFYSPYWRGDRHFTWSSEPRKGVAACSTKVVPSFLSPGNRTRDLPLCSHTLYRLSEHCRSWKFSSRNPLTSVLNGWHARSRRTLWTVTKLCSDEYSTSWRSIVALLIWVRRVGFLVIVKKKNAPTLSRERIVANKYWRL